MTVSPTAILAREWLGTGRHRRWASHWLRLSMRVEAMFSSRSARKHSRVQRSDLLGVAWRVGAQAGGAGERTPNGTLILSSKDGASDHAPKLHGARRSDTCTRWHSALGRICLDKEGPRISA